MNRLEFKVLKEKDLFHFHGLYDGIMKELKRKMEKMGNRFSEYEGE